MDHTVKRLPAMLVAASILALAACDGPGDARQSRLCERAGGASNVQQLSADLEAALDPVVEREMVAMEAVGLTIGVQCGASATHVKSHGMADLGSARPPSAATVYEIGSVSKQFIAAELVSSPTRGSSVSMTRPACTCRGCRRSGSR